MEATVYEAEARVEQTHWWFTGRRKLFARLIRRLGLDSSAAVLDVGTSTGTNLRMLTELGFRNVRGLDMSPDAIRFCAEKGLGRVELGDATKMPFADATFSLVLATDIIEHVDEDDKAIAEVSRVLSPKGTALITVPAFSSLWGFQDEVSHHKRRYRMKELLDRVRGGGLETLEAFHFNYLLFAPIWTARKLMKVARPSLKSENELNSPLINSVLGTIFDLDTSTASWLKPPFGVSILVLARKLPRG
jgi:SAM-dependent methyltransferase